MSEKMLSLKEIQSIEYSILLKFHEFCEVHQLNYMLTYGTLLGAVRHKGFIPWDDDIDVMMPREDYEKFIHCFNEYGIEDMELLGPEMPYYYYPFIKVCDQRTVAKMDDNKTEHGIWMDIFPVDNVPKVPSESVRMHKKIRFLKNVIIASTTDFSTSHKNWKLLAKMLYSIYGNILGKKNVTYKLIELATKYQQKDTTKMSAAIWQSSTGGDLDTVDVRNRQKLLFEDKEFYVPNHYDKYLTSIYGDYMKLPPENRRATHYLKAFYIE